MDTEKIGERIDELEKDIYNFSNIKLPIFQRVKKSFKNIYITTPIIVFFVLILLRPQFIYKEIYNKKGYVISRKISVKYFLIAFISITLVVYLGLCINHYKKK